MTHPENKIVKFVKEPQKKLNALNAGKVMFFMEIKFHAHLLDVRQVLLNVKNAILIKINVKSVIKDIICPVTII